LNTRRQSRRSRVKEEAIVQENDGDAAVREAARVMGRSVVGANTAQATPHLTETVARVDVARVLERIRTPQWAIEYRELEASKLALQSKADQQLAALRSLERDDAPDREVSAAGRVLGGTEYAYDDVCFRLRMTAIGAFIGPTSPVASLSWPERIKLGFRADRRLREYTDEDVAAIAANVEARLLRSSM
jgi:hypothetical protein